MSELKEQIKQTIQNYEKLEEKEDENDELQNTIYDEIQDYNEKHNKYERLKCVIKCVYVFYIINFGAFSFIILAFFIIIFPFDWKEDKAGCVIKLITIILITTSIKGVEFMSYVVIFFICQKCQNKKREIY